MSNRTDLYRFYDAEGGLLYIGISMSAIQRAAQHRDDKSWWPDVARMEVEHLPTREAALEAERRAIITERPRHNVVHNGNRRPEFYCPACLTPSVYSRTKDIFFHVDGSDNRDCMFRILRGEQIGEQNTTEETRKALFHDATWRCQFCGGPATLLQCKHRGKVTTIPWMSTCRDCDPIPGDDTYWFDASKYAKDEQHYGAERHLLDKGWQDWESWRTMVDRWRWPMVPRQYRVSDQQIAAKAREREIAAAIAGNYGTVCQGMRFLNGSEMLAMHREVERIMANEATT